MNTIPLIFNERHINYTSVGGTESARKVLVPVTCLVLNRIEGQYRPRVFDNILSKGFDQVISVEHKGERNAAGDLARMYPSIKFMTALEDVTQGDLLNIAMAESRNRCVLVVQDDMCVEKFSFTPRLAEVLSSKNVFCCAPRLYSGEYRLLPTVFCPSVRNSVFTVENGTRLDDGTETLFATDLAGFYDRDKYIQLGGADYTITSEYWQKADLFLRSWLWGERTLISFPFELTYCFDTPEQDQTVDLSYLRFYLKNLLPVVKNGAAVIPLSSFAAFNSRSSCGISESVKQFNNARRWVSRNKYRFAMDAVSLIENWGVEK